MYCEVLFLRLFDVGNFQTLGLHGSFAGDLSTLAFSSFLIVFNHFGQRSQSSLKGLSWNLQTRQSRHGNDTEKYKKCEKMWISWFISWFIIRLKIKKNQNQRIFQKNKESSKKLKYGEMTEIVKNLPGCPWVVAQQSTLPKIRTWTQSKHFFGTVKQENILSVLFNRGAC